MRLILFFFLFSFSLSAQNNIVKTVGYSYTNGTPTYTPAKAGSALALDTTTWRYYTWNGSSWLSDGFRVQTISGCSAPAYTPTKFQSTVVINNCSAIQGGPRLYQWNGSAWVPAAGGGNAQNGVNISSDTVKLGGALTENTTISKTTNQTLSLNLDTKQAGQRVIGANAIKTVEYPVSDIQVPTSSAVGAIVIKLNQSFTNYVKVRLNIFTSATKINVNPITSNSYFNMNIDFGALLSSSSINLSAYWNYSQNYPELEFALTNKLMVRLAKEASGNYVFIIGDSTDTWAGSYNNSGNFNAQIEKISLLENFGYLIDGAKPTMAFETNLSAYTILATEIANPYNAFTTTLRPVTQEKGYQYFDTDKQVMMVFNGIQYEPFGDATPILSASNSPIKFDRLREYGSVSAPVSGNITCDFSVTNVVRSQLIFHKSATVPTFPANAIVSGIYFTDVNTINVIEAEYRGINQVFFKINN